jgi:hypothetical protein
LDHCRHSQIKWTSMLVPRSAHEEPPHEAMPAICWYPHIAANYDCTLSPPPPRHTRRLCATATQQPKHCCLHTMCQNMKQLHPTPLLLVSLLLTMLLATNKPCLCLEVPQLQLEVPHPQLEVPRRPGTNNSIAQALHHIAKTPDGHKSSCCDTGGTSTTRESLQPFDKQADDATYCGSGNGVFKQSPPPYTHTHTTTQVHLPHLTTPCQTQYRQPTTSRPNIAGTAPSGDPLSILDRCEQFT